MDVREYFRSDWAIATATGLVAFDILALAAYTIPVFGWVILPVFAIGYGALLYRFPRAAFIVPFAELCWGSFGAGFSWEIGGGRLTVRMLFFVITVLWFALRTESYRSVRSYLRSRSGLVFALLSAVALWGAFIGVIWGQEPDLLYADGNAYLFLLYTLVWASILKRRDVPLVGSVIGGAALALSVKTLLLVNVFVNGYESANVPYLYLWIRDTRIGEITAVGGNLWRIFMQSQLYIGIAILQTFLLLRAGLRLTAVRFVAYSILFSALIASLSRSYWLGALVSLCVGFFLSIQFVRGGTRGRIKAFGGTLWAVVAAVAVVALVAYVPYGGRGVGSSLVGRLTSGTDPAGISRVQLLQPLLKRIAESPLLGQGYGAQVTYLSSDPRLRTFSNPDGTVTTFAFEWGYFDQVLKWGLLAFALYLYALLGIFLVGFRQLRSEPRDRVTVLLLLIGLWYIMIVHFTSPYLNHPLGLGYLALTLALLYAFSREQYAERIS